jgi:hypothetical protein
VFPKCLIPDPNIFSSRIPHEKWNANFLFSCFLCFQEQSLSLSHNQKDPQHWYQYCGAFEVCKKYQNSAANQTEKMTLFSKQSAKSALDCSKFLRWQKRQFSIQGSQILQSSFEEKKNQ